MKIKLTLLIILMFASFTGTSLFAERIETEKITISNDFVVISNATFNGSVTIGGETRTNFPQTDVVNWSTNPATSTVTMGTNAVSFGTNSIKMYGGVLSGTNGVYWMAPNGSNYWILMP